MSELDFFNRFLNRIKWSNTVPFSGCLTFPLNVDVSKYHFVNPLRSLRLFRGPRDLFQDHNEHRTMENKKDDKNCISKQYLSSATKRKKMLHKIAVLLFVVFVSCAAPKNINETQASIFPATFNKPNSLPAKNKFYIFILAGQSNMAGRGIIEAEDTVSSPLVLTLNKNNQWVEAKEPLHYYEPGRTGLDCGLSFGKELSKKYGKEITIGLVPCAIGGSSIEQWLGDSTYRGVALYSNFLQKAKAASQDGIIKGLLWHQGESNTGTKSHIDYKKKLESFFTKLRSDLQQPEMPIYLGPLGLYLTHYSFPYRDAINKDIKQLAQTENKIYLVKTSDFTHLKDTIHFDSRSQRLMGKRFAKAVYKNRNL